MGQSLIQLSFTSPDNNKSVIDSNMVELFTMKACWDDNDNLEEIDVRCNAIQTSQALLCIDIPDMCNINT